MVNAEMSLPDIPLNHAELLQSAFKSFTEATRSLEMSYHELEKQVDILNAELKQKNEALAKNLREKEQLANYLRNILESLDVGIFVCDHRGRVSLFNRVASEMFQIPVEQAIGKPLDTLLSDYSWASLFFDALPPDQHPIVETQAFRKDDSYQTVGVWRSLLRDKKSRMIGSIFILQDRTQLKRLERQLARKDRLAEMGEMAMHVAHEIRNPLGSIELFASVLKKDLAGHAEKRILCNHILTSVKTMDHIISNLLQFTRPHKPNIKRVPLFPFLEEFSQFIRPILTQSSIVLHQKFEKAIEVDLVADRELIWQVFLNLVLNAIQAMPSGGTLEMRVEEEKRFTLPEKDPFVTACGRDQVCFIKVSIQDTGEGMPPEVLKKIFAPFYSTKRKGTGLGLAIVQTVVDQHGGLIDVESRLGAGSTFKIYLPGCKGKSRKSDDNKGIKDEKNGTDSGY